MQQSKHKILLVIVAFLLSITNATAKNLDGRIGPGVVLTDFQRAPALSVRWSPSQWVTTDYLLGFNTDDSVNLTLLGVKVVRHFILEENLNFYLGVGGYYLAAKVDGAALVSTGIELDAILGLEFFLSGLPNLGLQVETGLGMRTVKKMALRTLGNGFLGLGVHYYF